MNDEPWPIDEGQERFRNYPLTSKERLFCATGEKQGSYSKPGLKKGITKNRIDKLPQRFHDIIEDILLIEDSDTEFKTGEEWRELCQDIIDIDARGEKIVEKNILYSNREQIYAEVQFGFELGYVLRSLHIKNRNELIWGFILGQFGLNKEEHEFERSVISHTLDYIQELEDDRVKTAKDLTQRDEVRNEYTEINRRKLKNIMQNYNINPPLKKSGFEQYVFANLTSTGYEFEKSDIDSFIDRFIESSDICLVDSLYHNIQNDQKVISGYVQQGAEAELILKRIYDTIVMEGDKFERRKFKQNKLPYVNKESQAVAALNKLSDKDDYRLKTTNPVFTEVGDDLWKITDYGCLLAHTIFEKQDAGWVYNYEIPPFEISPKERDIISRTIKEVDKSS